MSVSDKTIFRVIKDKKNPYVMLDKRPLENKQLSWRAKGILAYLLSRPDDWKIIFSYLEKQSTDGRDALRAGLAELMSAGHITYGQAQGEDGKFLGGEWQVFELPEAGNPEAGNPEAVEPDTGKPDSGKSGTTNKDSNKKDSNKKESKKESSFSASLSKGRKEAKERINEMRAKRGTLVDAYLDIRFRPGIKKAVRLDDIHSRFSVALKINASWNKWEEFFRFVDKQEQEHNEQLHVFLDWLMAKEGFDIQYYPPDNMQEQWPRAFVVKDHDEAAVELDPDGFAPVEL